MTNLSRMERRRRALLHLGIQPSQWQSENWPATMNVVDVRAWVDGWNETLSSDDGKAAMLLADRLEKGRRSLAPTELIDDAHLLLHLLYANGDISEAPARKPTAKTWDKVRAELQKIGNYLDLQSDCVLSGQWQARVEDLIRYSRRAECNADADNLSRLVADFAAAHDAKRRLSYLDRLITAIQLPRMALDSLDPGWRTRIGRARLKALTAICLDAKDIRQGIRERARAIGAAEDLYRDNPKARTAPSRRRQTGKKNKRGGKRKYDATLQKQAANAWATGSYTTYEKLKIALSVDATSEELRKMIESHNKSRARSKKRSRN